MTGKFFTIEGVDGSGKSTQLHLLESHFMKLGYDVILTREPGGTPVGEKIREILLDSNHGAMTSETEILLYAAARAQHLKEKILPAVAQGKIVLCDRFIDSSVAYQGYGREYGAQLVLEINRFATKGIEPDLTFFLDLPPQKGMERKKQEEGHILDRMEQEKMAFHQKVYEGYLALCDCFPHRIRRIPSDSSPEEIHLQILKEICLLLETE